MVRIYYENSNDWDQHSDIMGHKVHAGRSDQAIAALIQDLKQRGLLGETLVLIGSEFGRTPVLNFGGFRAVHNGRDHNVHGFTYLLAEGRCETRNCVRRDQRFRIQSSRKRCPCLARQAPHLLSLDHKRLTSRYSGRDFRLRDVEG